MIGRDNAGRTVIQLAADDRLLEQLLAFDGGAEDPEEGGDGEPDECQVLSFDQAPPRQLYRRQQYRGRR